MTRIILLLLIVSACDKGWNVEGSIIVPAGLPQAGVPVVVCAATGGSAHPAKLPGRNQVTILCRPIARELTFPLDEMVIAGHMPEGLTISAWLAPLPAAKTACADQDRVDMAVSDLDALSAAPCNTPPDHVPMDRTLVFDPAHPTYKKTRTGAIEERTLRIHE